MNTKEYCSCGCLLVETTQTSYMSDPRCNNKSNKSAGFRIKMKLCVRCCTGTITSVSEIKHAPAQVMRKDISKVKVVNIKENITSENKSNLNSRTFTVKIEKPKYTR